MKRTRRISALLLAVLMLFSLTLTSCKKEEPPLTADQVAVALFEMILKNNTAPAVELFGYADEAEARADWGMDDGSLYDEMAEEVVSQFEAMQLKATAEDVQTFIDAFISMFSEVEMTAKVKESDEKAGTAVVTCTISTFDPAALTEVMTESLTSVLSDPSLLSDEEALTSAIFNALSAGIASVTPSGEKADFDVDFELSALEVNGKERKAWLPVDAEAFGSAISTNALGG